MTPEPTQPMRSPIPTASASQSSEGLPPGSVCLADVERERVLWVWPGWLPCGKLTVLDGDPGLGKSTLMLDLAARVSRGGSMPDGARGDLGGPQGVVIMTAEDGLGDTVRPRLEAMRGDLRRIVAIYATNGEDGAPMPTLADHEHVRAVAQATYAALLLVDPVMAFLPADVNSHRDQDVRRILAPWARLAEETGAAVVLVRHLNKSGGSNAIYRGGGSIGIIGAARSAWLVAQDPNDETRRVLAHVKGNIGPRPESLAFEIVSADEDSATGRIEWRGPSALTANELTADPSPEDRGQLREAKAFLTEVLTAGPVGANDVMRIAREAGISERTLKRAKKAIGSNARKSANGWQWLPPEAELVTPTVPT